MKYGDIYETTLTNRFTKKSYPHTATYKYVELNGYHTNDQGNGLWVGDRQIIGTCDFSVAGCKTEKAAKAKIRKQISFYEEVDV